MDIVDIFNPLIATDHLDDSLILEPDLESEVCDCGTEPDILGGSLRNMLSDKDPMLGSASAQFSLPFSDNEDGNFQLTCSTVAELELTDESDIKESDLDTMEEEDSSELSSRKAKGKCQKSAVQSPRKSPRLLAQEPIRSLRNSTLAKRPSPANLALAKRKEQVKYVSVGAGSAKLPDRHEKQSPQKPGGKGKPQQQNVSENAQSSAETPCDTVQFEPVDSKSSELRSMETCIIPENTLEITCGNHKCTVVESVEQKVIESTTESQFPRDPLIALETENLPPDAIAEDANLHCLEAQVASVSKNPIERALESQCSAELLPETAQESTVENVGAQKIVDCATCGDERAAVIDHSTVKSALESQHSAESLIGADTDGMPEDTITVDVDLQKNISELPHGNTNAVAEELKKVVAEEQNVQLNERTTTVDRIINNEQKEEPIELDPGVLSIETTPSVNNLPKLEENPQRPVDEEFQISSELNDSVDYVEAKEDLDMQSNKGTTHNNASNLIKENISNSLELIKDSGNNKAVQLEAGVTVSPKPESVTQEGKLEVERPVSPKIVAKDVNESEKADGSGDHLVCKKQDNINEQVNSTEQQLGLSNEEMQDLSEHKDHEEVALEKQVDAVESKSQVSKHEKLALKPQHKLAQDPKPEQIENFLHSNRKKAKLDIQPSELLKQSKSHISSLTSKRKAVDQDEHHPHKTVKCLKTQVGQDAKLKIDQAQKQNFNKVSPVSQVAKTQTTNKIVSMIPAGHKSKKTIQTSKYNTNSTPKLTELPAKQVTRYGYKPAPSTGKIVSQQVDNIKEKDKGRIMEHSNEDDKDKLKARKNEKGILPRQRRSSKSLSLDEPPLFIPDNLPVVKKEETDMDHSAPVAASDLWDPKRLCGFCKKPHNSRFMVGCGRCDDWFHGECVGLTLSQAQQLEKEDKEYICLKCCAVEDKKAPSVNHSQTIKHQCVQNDMEKAKPELFHEHTIHLTSEKVICSEELNTTTNAAGVKSKTEIIEKTEQFPSKKHKVKMLRKVSGMRTGSTDSKDLETKDTKKSHLGNDRLAGQITGASQAPEHKKGKPLKDLAVTRLGQGEKLPKLDLKDKQAVKKKAEKGGSNSTPPPTSPSAPQPTVEQIRQNVRHSLMDILAKRLSESDLKVPEERATKVAARIERKLFSFYGDTDTKYKSKYRSLMFNLKDPKNQVLFKRVLKGDIVPDHLIRMSPEELASKELAAWRRRENRHMIEMIEKEQREVERRPITKITHKGEIEIESETPMKESEVVVTEEADLKTVESKPVVEKLEETEEETATDGVDDTTCQHKKHLFDLNCKICTGRMAPPAEELPLPKAKVATSVMRRQSDVDAEMAFLADALSSASSILSFDATMGERPESPQPTTSSVTRSDTYDIAEDESRFLARLDSLWKGFINMPSVAKFVTKAYPVSGSADHLTEDLPDTIQVGGRIPPQMVWDYVDKIKASGTKEICVIRFCPVTEEDQITYTSLYAYFNSRQRYGVVANNVKQVKDMYLIPLGALEKIPYRLLPFDGPGLEVVRQNLLLGLIIRQRIKRLFSASPSEEVSETEKLPISLPQEKKSKPEYVEDEGENDDDDEENQFFNSFTSVLAKFRSKPKQSSPVESQILKTPPSSPAEPIPILSTKPLRFLPGVLVGWENQSTALELSNRPLDDILQSLLGDADREAEQKSISSIGPELGEPLVSKDSKMSHPEETGENQENAKDILHDPPEENEKADNILEDVKVAETPKASGFLATLTLKDKPPDVSTEAFLSSLAAIKSQPNHKEEHEKLRHHYKVKKVKVESSKEQKEASGSSPSQPVTPKIELSLLEPTTNAEEVDSTQETLTRVSQVVNVSRDPRQAAVRKQQGITAISQPVEDSADEQYLDNRKDKCEDESLNIKDAEEAVKNPLETEQQEITTKQVPKDPANTQSQQSSKQVQGSTPCITEVSQSVFHNISNTVPETEPAGSLHKGEAHSDTEMVETHTIETVQSYRRETTPLPSFHGPRAGSHFEFSSNAVPTQNQTQVSAVSTSLPSGGPSCSPVPSGNIFPPPLLQLHNFSQVQGHSSGFPFQRGLPNANFQPPGNLMPSFMPVRPPPLPPPPFSLQSDPHLRFHSPDLGAAHALGPNHMMPWLPPIPCPPQHHLGLIHLAHGQAMPPFTSDHPIDVNRYALNAGTSNFQPLKDDHRQERHHCDLWDRYSQRSERNFGKEHGSHHRHRFYSDSYHRRKDRHKERERDKYWDRDSERDRDKYKDRDRDKGRDKERRSRHEERHRDKDRDRYRERSHDGADSRRVRSKERERSHDGADSRRERSKERERSHDGADSRRERSKEREKSHDGAAPRRERSKERERSNDGAASRKERSKERERSHDGAASRRERSKERERSHDGVDLKRERSKEREKSHDGAASRRERSKERERSHDGAVSRRERSKERERSHDGVDSRREQSKEREKSHDGADSRRERSKEREKGKSENEDHDSDRDRGKGRSKDKHREKVQEREKDADWEKHHRDKDHDKRDHSDRSKSKRRKSSPESTTD
ncbi:PHD finger protein 3 isoform X1 [Cetorhinus maximus]